MNIQEFVARYYHHCTDDAVDDILRTLQTIATDHFIFHNAILEGTLPIQWEIDPVTHQRVLRLWLEARRTAWFIIAERVKLDRSRLLN